jgi:DivIVA domain-containing protein
MMPCVSFDEDPESLARYIRNATFRTSRFSSGYDQQEVDEFLNAAVDQVLREGRVSAPPRFTEIWLRPGYVRQDVDALIAEIMRLVPPFL